MERRRYRPSRDNEGRRRRRGELGSADYMQRATTGINDIATPPHQLRRQRSSNHGNRPTAEAINWTSADYSSHAQAAR